MADFNPAYKIIRAHEGNYVNHKLDAGKETYAGIARKFWPSWIGWQAVDEYKLKNGEPKRNQLISVAEPFVAAFYKRLWDGQKFSEIKNQSIANIIYDFMINSGSLGIKKTQEVLHDKFNADIVVDGALGIKSVSVINIHHPQDVFFQIKQARINFYHSLVQRKPDQAVFLTGWLNRINSFTYA